MAARTKQQAISDAKTLLLGTIHAILDAAAYLQQESPSEAEDVRNKVIELFPAFEALKTLESTDVEF